VVKRIYYLLIICISVSCTSIKEYNKKITVEKHSIQSLKADLDFTYQILKEYDPGIYWYISKKELELKFDSVSNSITEPLTSADFYKKITPLVASIKCGHTSIKYPSLSYNKIEIQQLKKKVSPLEQFTYAITKDKKLYILTNKGENTTLKIGSELLTIDGIDVKNAIENLKPFISSDGYNETHYDVTLERFFAQRFKTYYKEKDSLLIKYKLDNGSIGETYVKVLNKKQVDTVKNVNKHEIKHPKYRGKYENGEPQLDFKFLEGNHENAYLKIKSFSVPMANYEMFYKECFDSISKNGTKNLILDLRDNGGGSLDASRNLFAYLTDKEFVYLDKPVTNGYFDARKYGNGYQKINYFLFGHNDRDIVKQDRNGDFYSFMRGYKPMQPNKNNFKGKVYVLINGYTFSAASLLSANLKGINRATFIGIETGGGFNQCVAGSLPVITLKNSKLLLRFGLYRMAPNAKTEIIGHGIFPDIELSSSIKDRLNGIDQELNWVLNNSKTSK